MTIQDEYNKHDIEESSIVGWQIYYSDGSQYSSLDSQPEDLPLTDAQVLSIYYPRSDNKKGLWRLMLVGKDEYPIPNTKITIQGDWTSLVNHDKITDKAGGDWLDD